MVTVEEALCITVPDCAPVFVLHWQLVDDKRYIKVTKSDSKIVRLLVGQCSGKARLLTTTTIIEDIIKLRDQVRQELLEKDQSNNNNNNKDLGIDAPQTRKRRKSSGEDDLPETVCVTAPAVGDVASQPMRVITGQQSLSPLWVELTVDNIEYLRACVGVQSSNSSAKRTEEDSDDAADMPNPGSGIIWSQQRCAYRVRYKVDGKLKCKDFRASSNSASDRSEAAQNAAEFKASVA